MDEELAASAQVTSLAELVGGWRAEVPGLLLHDPGGPAETLVRSGELLVFQDELPRAVDRLGRWIDHVEHLADLRAARLRLRPAERDRCVAIAADHDGCAPHHVHVGCPIMIGTSRPLPPGAEPAAPPRHERWDVTAAVLDTGLDPHPWFAGRPWFTEREPSPEVLDGRTGRDRQAGHGTFVAGVLLQHAPGVVIRHHRVLSSLGLTDDLTVAAGLRRARREAADHGERLDVVLLTAGCHTADDRCPPVLRDAISAFPDAVVVAAAGNGGTSRPFWPAALPEVLAVGADAPFANRGPWVDAVAPGVDVVSSHVRFDAGTREYGCARWSGTSFAAPRVAARVAHLVRRGLDARQARAEAAAEFGISPARSS
ncbi:S8/S53 family peptidase [Umezawaea sp. Da 62-37]|uniref:S8 family peptidase n=1 Tax=Umezawaea sp. Da 62-37 TaxID=3075927 RepID=UPI0028F6F9BD|nr:S8/S53 family peptidase [Umezawaea sp. Da 62-37]WNV91104.1 S8/S53 family peptidase [Umezawaea sp. Da 62-37]